MQVVVNLSNTAWNGVKKKNTLPNRLRASICLQTYKNAANSGSQQRWPNTGLDEKEKRE
jgi:hypothetical protein